MASQSKDKKPEFSAKYEFLKETYKARVSDVIVEGFAHMNRHSLMRNLSILGQLEYGAQTLDALRRLQKKHNAEQVYDNDEGHSEGQDQAMVFDAFAKMLDPTHDRKAGKSYKYLHWICEQFLTYRHNDKPMLVEDFYKHHDNLRDFDTWSGRLAADNKPNQIDDAAFAKNGFRAVPSILRPYQKQREDKRIENEFRRLTPAARKEIEDGTSVLYEGEEGRVLMIHNWEASKFWGTHTEWCITQKDTDKYFAQYETQSPIIFYLPNASAEDILHHKNDVSFKFAAVDGHLWNEHDDVVTGHFPECLHKLAHALRDEYAAQEECLSFLDGFGRAKVITEDCIELDTAISATHSEDQSEHTINYDDFETVVYAMRHDTEYAGYHFNHASDRLKAHPDFLIAALEVERRTSSIANASSPRPRETQLFKDLLLGDINFRKRALASYGEVYFDLPLALREQEDIALRSLETHPIGIIEILKNITVINNMYSGTDKQKMGLADKRLHFLTRAMLVNPSVISFAKDYTKVDISAIPDRAWLAAFDKAPYVLASHLQTQHEWFERYCENYKGSAEHPHAPRQIVIRAINDFENVYPTKYDKPSPKLFSILEAHHPHMFADPEILSLCIQHAHGKYSHVTAQHALSQEFKLRAIQRNIRCVDLLSLEDTQDPRIMREVLRHVVDTGQQLSLAPHLRHLPFSSSKHPETLMSCSAVLRVTDHLCPDGFVWPDFQARIDAFRTAPQSTSAPTLTAKGMKP